MGMMQKGAHPLSVDNSTVFILSWVYTKAHGSFPIIQAPIMEQRACAVGLCRELGWGELRWQPMENLLPFLKLKIKRKNGLYQKIKLIFPTPHSDLVHVTEFL